MTLNRIDPLSCGKLMAVLYAMAGLLVGGFFALLSMLGAAIGAAASGSGEAWFGAIFGVGAVIIMPVIYAVLGFIGGILVAVLYNLAASVFGGLELDVTLGDAAPGQGGGTFV